MPIKHHVYHYEKDKHKKIFKRTEHGWPRLCYIGKLQSPVELSTKFAYHVPFPAINLKNFHKFEKCVVDSCHDTVRITFPNVCYCKRPKLSGAGFNRKYTLENIHFHWPAEHVIDGIRYDLEAHFVFFDDRYENLKNALAHPYGITVMAILYLKTNFTRSNNFKILADCVKLVSSKVNQSAMCHEAIDMYQFLPYDHAAFYRYPGSTSTPFCMEQVNWIVFKNTSNISLWDCKNFTKIYSKAGHLIGSNNRELQKLNDRIVSIREVA